MDTPVSVPLRVERKDMNSGTVGESNQTIYFLACIFAGPRSPIGNTSDSEVPVLCVRPHTFVSPSTVSRRAVVSYS